MADFEGRVDGFKVDRPASYMPKHIIAKIGMQRQKMIDFLMQQEGDWVNIDICEARESKKYYGKQNIRVASSNTGGSSFVPDIEDDGTVEVAEFIPDSPGPEEFNENYDDYLDF